VRDSDLYELKADGEGRGDVEGQAAAFEVGERAEDGRAHDEADVTEGEEVGRANLELANPIVLSHCRVVKFTERLQKNRLLGIIKSLTSITGSKMSKLIQILGLKPS
jgi:hypothetical protein